MTSNSAKVILFCVLCLVVAAIVCVSAFAQTKTSDKVYSFNEVEKPAVIQDRDSVIPALHGSLNCSSGGWVKFSYILRRSGKVSNLNVEHSPQCEATPKSLTILRKLKFTPALKEGLKVSQSDSLTLEIKSDMIVVPR
jgi:hypothetical protein